MFSERLTQLMQQMQISSAELANVMRCDTSNISRMCSGARVPKFGGTALMRLLRGLYRCAVQKNTLGIMCEMIGCPPDTVSEEVMRYLLTWLYEGTELPVRTVAEQPYRSFGERLDAVMRLTELSNVRFGKMISLDASYISRFRNGVRSPRSNPDTVSAICRVLFERICQQGRLEGLERLMGQTLPADRGDAFVAFSGWLCDFSPEQADPTVEGLLASIETFSAKEKRPLPVSASDEHPERSVYTGGSGLREAVMRFLTEVLRKNGKELWLYSDVSIDWMTEEPGFLEKWSSLMHACLRNGVQIRVIHHVDRRQGELLAAIRTWLPLYMAGTIRSFCLRPEEYGRFSHTLFLCPEVACIEGYHPVGSTGLFRYHDRSMTAVLCDMFDALCSKAAPLVQIGHAVPVSYHLQNNSMIRIGTSLSLATMPEVVLQSALDRCGITESDRLRAERAWQSCRQSMMQMLAGGESFECCPLASAEELKNGNVRMELTDAPLYYTEEEYAAHIREILNLCKKYPNFRFYPMQEAAFAHTLLLISRDQVTVSKFNIPRVTFRISHPVLCDAFLAYAERIKVQNRLDTPDLHALLEQYL
ncbi:MAG: hypothetical protein K5695_04860 [Oscillospiraceae bacterium]|nr:hypothetical protein [Oscillospiraceae bacterium]